MVKVARDQHPGIDFGRLATIDPLAGQEEGVARDGGGEPLMMLEQIRFVR
jgi:hypothetical protein